MSETLGASFSIDITKLKAGLTQANRLIRESESKFKAAAAGMDDWSDSEAGLNAKIKSLTSIIELQKEKVNALQKEYDRLIDDGLDPMSAEAIKLRTQINNETASLKKNEAELKNVTDGSKKTSVAIETASKAAEKAEGGFTVLKGALANLVADGFRKAIDSAKQFVTSMVEVGSSFDSAMAQVSAVSGATGDQLQTLRDKAKEMGETTKFTATEAADAFNYMAMAGWKTEDMLGGIEGILNLAAASGSDLATTSDIVTDALTAMGYTAKDAGRLADVMAAASSNANTNVEMMGATFQYAAPLVGALGYNMEDTAVAIGLMANAGIKGEKAGTALRSMFTRLAAPPKAAKTAMSDLGITLTDTSGKMKPFSQVVQELRKSFNGLSETEQAHYASAIAGQEAMSGMLAIVNAAPADFDKLTKAVAESEGAAKKMSSTMIDNLGGDFTVLQSKLEGIKIQVYEKFEPTLRSALQSVQKWLDKVDWKKFGDQASKSLKNVIDRGKELGKEALPIIKDGFKIVGDVTKFAVNNFEALAKVTGIAVVALKGFKAAMAVTTAITAAKTAVAGLTGAVGLATKAQTIWNAVMSANPIGAVITAVGLLAGGIALLVKRQQEASQADLDEIRNKELLSETQRALITSTEEATNAYRENKNASMEVAEGELANIGYTQRLWQELQTLADANGTVKAGYEGRANYILGELNNALGTEYSLNDGIISQYGDMKTAIESLIETKKAETMLTAYEEQYKQAIQNVADAEMSRATQAQELSIQRQALVEAEAAVMAANAEYEKKSAEAKTEAQFIALAKDTAHLNKLKENRDAEKEKLDELQGKYNETSGALSEYYADISTYENASAELLQGNTEKAIQILTQRGEGFKTAASTVQLGAEEQKKVLGQQVIDTEVNAKLMEEAYNKGVEGVTEEMVKTAKTQADQAKQEFKNIGGNITEGIADGAGNKTWVLNSAMTRLINDALSAARKAADSHSPSKKFEKKLGITLPQGVAVGVTKGTKYVVNAVKKQIGAIQDSYDLSGISESVNVGITNKSNNSNGTNKETHVAGAGGVVVYQTNNYSQAHSRYELYKSKQQTAAAVRLALAGV